MLTSFETFCLSLLFVHHTYLQAPKKILQSAKVCFLSLFPQAFPLPAALPHSLRTHHLHSSCLIHCFEQAQFFSFSQAQYFLRLYHARKSMTLTYFYSLCGRAQMILHSHSTNSGARKKHFCSVSRNDEENRQLSGKSGLDLQGSYERPASGPHSVVLKLFLKL